MKIEQLSKDSIYEFNEKLVICEYLDIKEKITIFKYISTGETIRIINVNVKYLGEKEDYLEFFV